MRHLTLPLVIWAILSGGFHPAMGLETMDDAALSSVAAQSGLSIGVSDLVAVYHYDEIRGKTVQYTDPFGVNGGATGQDPGGTLVLQNGTGFVAMGSSSLHVDVGGYQAPDETYSVVDLYKSTDRMNLLGLAVLDQTENAHIPNFSGGNASLDDEADAWEETYWWTVAGGAENSPLHDKVAAVRLVVDQMENTFFSTGADFSMEHPGKETLHGGRVDIRGLQFPRGGLDEPPPFQATFFPHTSCGIAGEIRTRIRLEEVAYTSANDSQSVLVSGIYLKEAFSDELRPMSEKPYDYGDRYHSMLMAADGSYKTTRMWKEDFTAFHENIEEIPDYKKMYGGAFLIGNLNEVDFNDAIAGGVNGDDSDTEEDSYWMEGNTAYPLKNQDGQLRVEDGRLQKRVKNDAGNWVWVDLKLRANPATLDMDTGDDEEGKERRAGLVINLPVHGSVRVGEIRVTTRDTFNGALVERSMGPLAIDGLHVPLLRIKFPGDGGMSKYNTDARDAGGNLPPYYPTP